MRGLAALARRLDPRLKLGAALVLGPVLWLVGAAQAGACALVLLALVAPLAADHPLGGRMVRSLLLFVVFWVAAKAGLDALSGLPLGAISAGAGELAIRLAALLLLGLFLALSSSARALGMAVAWAVRPVVGREQAWRLALSLALMVHFLPLCLSTVSQVRQTMARRCPRCGFFLRMVVIPQAVIRALGQKTWNQTLAVAGRNLDRPEAWEPDFSWTSRDTLLCLLVICALAGLIFPVIFVPSP
ncbi:MAG: cobalt transporter [Pseudodesulfovibrio sp.]|nr:cobalt transporter [Pseudomonadota bacterium]MBV1764582.1 cobalt transporter [Pseudodesulfovibrio sp.]MBU4243989.1 cobalt transporter [Pseudomonadota bacterium]MBU4379782.1 cobalt transporter [Pseudomonadota bacterium]MBU4476077.1 cobalt transporter [Pseudomonadota bacterium]